MIKVWLLIGLGVWLGLAVSQVQRLKENDWKSISLGAVLAILFWPYALYNNYQHQVKPE